MFQPIQKPALLGVLAICASAALAQSPVLVNTLSIPGSSVDLYAQAVGANYNRLGGPFSDLFFDRQNETFYGLVDRGPGGGLISYETRVEKMKVNINDKTGGISNYRIQSTILFKNAQGTAAFNGLNPLLLNGDKSILGYSFDPEGITVGPNGRLYVADEYGPSIFEFQLIEISDILTEARFVRAFDVPDNLVPKQGLNLNFVDGRGTLTSGRQDNRGYEGITITPDGTTLLACLQDPLILEGPSNEGRRGRNVRLVAFDVATGHSTGQFVYQLESIADINARISAPVNYFGATSQGRNIGLSGITAVNNTDFLVIERDNRGVGVDNPTGSVQVGSKRVFRISITGATDVSSTSLAGTNTLPLSVVPVSKSLFIDVASGLVAAGLPIGEKFEGIAVGPQLKDGSFAILIGTDNDFSVTQSGVGEQFDVYTDGTSGPIDGDAQGRTLIPIYVLSFKGDVPSFVPAPKK